MINQNMSRPSLLLAFIFIITSCAQNNSNWIELNIEDDLFPEGIAIDAKAKRLYLNSLKKNKIVSCSLDGIHADTFLETGKYNYLAGFGMTIKEDTLYALGNGLTGDSNTSILLLLQLSTGQLIDSYTLDDGQFHYLNDLAISSKNEIFITDSESNKIYRISRPGKLVEVFLDNQEIPHSNGIAISENDQFLYVGSTKGICIVEVETGKLLNHPNQKYAGIDGLKFHRNFLYAIVNGWGDISKNGLFKFKLNDNFSEVIDSYKLVEFDDSFKIPTTFDMVSDTLFFIKNSQIDQYDEKTNSIRKPEELESYRLMKLKVD